MSTFAVFGMTESHARYLARKQIQPMWLTKEERLETPEEHEARVEKFTEKLMQGERVCQLSPLFDAPQFCKEFIALAKAQDRCRHLQVKRKDRVVVERRMKTVIGTAWADYQGSELCP